MGARTSGEMAGWEKSENPCLTDRGRRGILHSHCEHNAFDVLPRWTRVKHSEAWYR